MKKIIALVILMTAAGHANANLGWGDVTDGGKQATFYANSPTGIHATCYVAPTRASSAPTITANASVGVIPNQVTLTPMAPGATLTIGNTYQINSHGTTNFTLVGANSNTVDQIFVATGTTPGGTGTVIDVTACDSGKALRKFVDKLPVLSDPQGVAGSDASEYIPRAIPMKWVSPEGVTTNDDYYEIAVMMYYRKFHTDLPSRGTYTRGFVQIDPLCTDGGTPADVNSKTPAASPATSKAIPLLDGEGHPVMIARPDGKGGFKLKQACGVDYPHYLGPIITATHSIATRVKLYNALPVGRADGVSRNGDLPIPVDTTLSGAGFGPDGGIMYTQNRVLIHLHGSDSPWISDGTPHQWMTPPSESGQFGAAGQYAFEWKPSTYFPTGTYVTYNGIWYQTNANITTGTAAPTHTTGTASNLVYVGSACTIVGLNNLACEVQKYNTAAVTKAVLGNYVRGPSNYSVPDMDNGGPGTTTYYYPNGLSARTLWYHDHSYGLTRLNVYEGLASMYLLTDPNDPLNNPTDPSYIPPERDVPLVLQDKTFVPKDVARQDARWDSAVNGWGLYGDLWYPHVIEVNQNPQSSDNTNPIGRWDWGPWMSPPTPAYYGRLPTGEHVTITATNALSGKDGAAQKFVDSWAYGNVLTIAGNAPPTPTVSKLNEVTLTPEAWEDTTLVNGKAYPSLTVSPQTYRFRALNAANDRMFNLGFYVAADRFSYAQVSPFDRPIVNNPIMCQGTVLDQTDANIIDGSGNFIITDGQQYVKDGNYYLGTSTGTMPFAFPAPVKAWKNGDTVAVNDQVEKAGVLYKVTAAGTLGTSAQTQEYARGWTASSNIAKDEKIYSAGSVFNVSNATNGVVNLTIQSEGKGYGTGAIVNFGPGCAVAPIAAATISSAGSGGKIVAIDITSPGSGCTSVPTVTVTPANPAASYTPANVTAYIGPTLGMIPPTAPANQMVQIASGTVTTFNTANTIPLKEGSAVQLDVAFGGQPAGTTLYVYGYTPAGRSSIFNLSASNVNPAPLSDASNAYPTLYSNIIQQNGGATLNFIGALEFNTTATPGMGSLKYLTNVSNCTEVLESDAAGLAYWPTSGGLTGTGWGSKFPQGLFSSPVPSSDYLGPNIQMIMNEGGYIPNPQNANIPSTPANWESNVKNAVFLNIAEIGWFVPPAVRTDGVVDFANFRGTTLIMYNNAPAPLPAPDVRLQYFTGMGDQTGSGGSEDVMAGYGPNSRTMMQVYVDPALTPLDQVAAADPAVLQSEVQAYYNAHQPVTVVPVGTKGSTTTGGFFTPTATAGIFSYTPLSFATQTAIPWSPGLAVQVGMMLKDSKNVNIYTVAVEGVLGTDPTVAPTNAASVCGAAPYCVAGVGGTAVISSSALKYTGAPTCTANIALATPVPCAAPAPVAFTGNGAVTGAYVDGKTIFETFDATWGRMNALFGVELPPQGNVLVNTTVPLGYIDPVTENVADGGVYVWQIVHNGVDSHPIHFHLFDVQILNRVGIDGMNHPITPDEEGWKETVLLSPLTTSFIAIRARAPAIPFGLPVSSRLMDPSQAVGAVSGFSLIDPATGAAPLTPIANAVVNYGWEYTWHCHILGHEENDFMRPMVFTVGTIVAPAAPSAPSFNGNVVNWVDATPRNSAISYWSHLNNETGFTLTRTATPATVSLPTKTVVLPANVTSYNDLDLATFVAPAGEFSYQYSIAATNIAGTSPAVIGKKVYAVNAPTAVSVGVPGATSLAVTYSDQSALETGYHVYFTPSGGGAATAVVCSANQGPLVAPATGTCTVNYASNPGLTPGNAYNFQVAAYANDNTVGLGYKESTLVTAIGGPVTIPLPSVTAFTAVPTALNPTTGVTLTWTNPVNAAGAVLSACSTGSACTTTDGNVVVGTPVVAPTTRVATTTVTGLIPNTTYYFSVRAGAAPAPTVAAQAITNPTPVTSIATTLDSLTTCASATSCPATVNWTNPTSIGVPYTVTLVRSPATATAIPPIASGTTSYRDLTLLPGTAYTYTATVNGATTGKSTSSATAPVSTPVLAAVTGLTAVATTATPTTGITLNWTNPTSGIGVVTRLCTGGPLCLGISGAVVAGTPNGTTRAVVTTVTGLAPNTPYYIDVVVTPTGLAPGPAATATAMTYPAPVTGLGAVAGACTSATSCPVSVSWTNANAAPSTVTITRTQTAPVPAVAAATTLTTTASTSPYSDTTALPGTTYTYAATVVGSTVAPGTGRASTAVSFAGVATGNAPAQTVSAFTAVSTTTNSAVLTWTNPTTGAGAVKTACTGAACTGIVGATVGAITVNATTRVATATVTGLLPNTAYNFGVGIGTGTIVAATAMTSPGPVTGLAAVAGACTSATSCPVSVSWTNANAAPSTVTITRTQTAPTAGAATTITTTASTSPYSDTTAAPGATYTYAATVVGSTVAPGTGKASTALSVTGTKTGAWVGTPVLTAATVSLGAIVNLTWTNNSVGTVNSYIVQYSATATPTVLTVWKAVVPTVAYPMTVTGTYTIGSTMRTTINKALINAGVAGTYSFRVVDAVTGVAVTTVSAGQSSTSNSIAVTY